jgi:hypothetical protein
MVIAEVTINSLKCNGHASTYPKREQKKTIKHAVLLQMTSLLLRLSFSRSSLISSTAKIFVQIIASRLMTQEYLL